MPVVSGQMERGSWGAWFPGHPLCPAHGVAGGCLGLVTILFAGCPWEAWRARTQRRQGKCVCVGGVVTKCDLSVQDGTRTLSLSVSEQQPSPGSLQVCRSLKNH